MTTHGSDLDEQVLILVLRDMAHERGNPFHAINRELVIHSQARLFYTRTSTVLKAVVSRGVILVKGRGTGRMIEIVKRPAINGRGEAP